MNGDFLIDGVSAYGTYGMFVRQNGFADAVSLPSFKTIETVEWPEEDGIDADLSAPVLNRRTMNITFGFKHIGRLPDFFAMMSGNHTHLFTFSDIGRTMTLRMTNNGSLSSLVRAGSLTLSLTEDAVPVSPGQPYALGATRVTQRGFLLDGIDLSRYGCWVLEGFLSAWRRAPQVKENLTVSSRVVTGQTYYGQTDGVKYRAKDLTLSLLMNATDVQEFNDCYDALVYALTRPGERTIRLGIMTREEECFYKSLKCERIEVCPSGTVWFKFSLTLTMLSFRPDGITALLAAENGYYVITEDGMTIHIATI